MKLCNKPEKAIRVSVWFEDGCSKLHFSLSLPGIHPKVTRDKRDKNANSSLGET
jgi:hypothetical protein